MDEKDEGTEAKTTGDMEAREKKDKVQMKNAVISEKAAGGNEPHAQHSSGANPDVLVGVCVFEARHAVNGVLFFFEFSDADSYVEPIHDVRKHRSSHRSPRSYHSNSHFIILRHNTRSFAEPSSGLFISSVSALN